MDDFIDWLEMADIERKYERENMVNHNLHNTRGIRVASWLNKNGYSSVVEWALDSNYRMDEDGVWFDDDGNEVDILSQAYFAMEAANESV